MAEDKTKETTKEAPAAAEDTALPVTEQAKEQPEAAAAAPAAKRRKAKRTVSAAHVHVLATFNNTIVTVTDDKGNTLTTASAGASGFRGSKKGTAYAAQVAAEKAIGDARNSYGVTKVDVFVKGVGLGRDAAVRSLINQKMTVESVRDVTGVPHGGVRPRKPKRN